MTGRRIVLGLFLMLVPQWAAADAAGPSPETAFPLTPELQAFLEKDLVVQDSNYDPKEHLQLKMKPRSGNSSVAGMLHPLRDSVFYAEGLLDSTDAAHHQRALEVLDRIVGLQDQDPASKTFGTWPYYLEEPLDKIDHPDMNWADFIGTELLMITLRHNSMLPSELQDKIKTATISAALSIQKRNVAPDYTNIALLGTFQTLVTGETYNRPDLKTYGAQNLQRMIDYTKEQGGFTEYNSPTYTLVSLSALGRMLMFVKDPASRPLIEELYQKTWSDIAHHFHPPTLQWAGPHSRVYDPLFMKKSLYFLERAMDGQAHFGFEAFDLEGYTVVNHCPPDLIPFFAELSQPREEVETFAQKPVPLVGTTYLTPSFALGSINRGNGWEQQDTLIAYWGTAEKPNYFRARFLHDGRDFADAQFFSVQKKGRVLAGINFGTDGGDTHIIFDRNQTGSLHAKDLRLRFEFGGADVPQLVAPPTLDQPAVIQLGTLKITLAVPYANWGGSKAKWELGQDKGRAYLDVVLYSGDDQAFDLKQLTSAAAGFAVQIDESNDSAWTAPTAQADDQHLALSWKGLGLTIPLRPAPVAQLQTSAVSVNSADLKY